MTDFPLILVVRSVVKHSIVDITNVLCLVIRGLVPNADTQFCLHVIVESIKMKRDHVMVRHLSLVVRNVVRCYLVANIDVKGYVIQGLAEIVLISSFSPVIVGKQRMWRGHVMGMIHFRVERCVVRCYHVVSTDVKRYVMKDLVESVPEGKLLN